MSKGTVKYFNEVKGFGFISSDDISSDVYVHYTAISMDGYKTLKEGQDVLYDLVSDGKQPHAENVKPIQ